ncbi:hypothetical protein T08_10970 [Trichinella sp. T8]|nr:hypothetical protein T08_10970 [Trichinella sp. T8]
MEAAETIRELSSGRASSVVAVTIRARMMATRRRDRGSEDESAKSNSGGRNGADVEADPAAATGGTLQLIANTHFPLPCLIRF